MTQFAGVVARQAQNLMDEVRRQKETRCRRIMQEAEHRANDLTRAARREARLRMRDAIQQERQRMDTALSRARGRVRTRAREALTREYRMLLNQGWSRLEAALLQRWKDGRQRLTWCQAALIQAHAAFAAAEVRIAHPPDLTAADRRQLSGWAQDKLAQQLAWQETGEMDAGLRIHVGGACLDASIAGLVSDHAEVEAMLLAAWEQAADRAGSDAPGIEADERRHG